MAQLRKALFLKITKFPISVKIQHDEGNQCFTQRKLPHDVKCKSLKILKPNYF